MSIWDFKFIFGKNMRRGMGRCYMGNRRKEASYHSVPAEYRSR